MAIRKIKIIFGVLVWQFCTFNSSSSDSVTIGVAPTIIINPKHPGSKSTIGVVPGTRNCGGLGQVLQWRYETCKSSENPCRIPADGVDRKAEVDFIPGRDVKDLGLYLIVRSVDGKVSRDYKIEEPILNAGVHSGEVYTISNAGGVTEELKGKLAVFHYILYDKLNGATEICAEAEFEYF